MKKYLLFKGHYYYPSGGWSDYIADFDTLEEAEIHLQTISSGDWAQIVDTDTLSNYEYVRENQHTFKSSEKGGWKKNEGIAQPVEAIR